MSRIAMFIASFLCLTAQLPAQDNALIKAVDTSLDGTQPGSVNVSGDIYYLRPPLVVKDATSTVVAGTISHRRKGQNYAQLYYLIQKKQNGSVASKFAFVEGGDLNVGAIVDDARKLIEIIFGDSEGGDNENANLTKGASFGNWKNKKYPTWLPNAEKIFNVYVERVKSRKLTPPNPKNLKAVAAKNPSKQLQTFVDRALGGTQPDRIDVGGDVYYLRPSIVAKEGDSTIVAGLISHRRRGRNYHQTWYLIVTRGNSVQRFDSRFEDHERMHFDGKLVDRSYGRVEKNAQTIVETFAARLKNTLSR